MTALIWVIAIVLTLALVNVIAFWIGIDVAGLAGASDDEGDVPHPAPSAHAATAHSRAPAASEPSAETSHRQRAATAPGVEPQAHGH